MSLPKIHPNYYAIIPANVRYDSGLSANAKLLYGEIAALCNQEGFCWASNSYFAKLYEISPKRVSELIVMLEHHGHVITEVDKASGNARNIYLTQAIPKNTDRYPEKGGEAIPKNTEHNNKTNKEDIMSETSSSADSTDVRKIYQLYLTHFKCPDYENSSEEQRTELLAKAGKRYKLTPVRRDAIKRRLEDAGFKMLAAAIIGYAREPWYQGDNDRGWTADLQKFICRSYEKVEEGANKYEQQKAGGNTNDPWAKL